MVKRAEDGRCLVVCRIWVSDLGLQSAVGRLVRQETCFLDHLSLVPLSDHVLSSRFLSLRSSRRAGSPPLATLRSSLSRELKTPRIVREHDFHGIVRSNGEV